MHNEYANRALWKAIWRGQPEDARQALLQGADPDGRDPATMLTPLMLAAGMGSLEIVDLLLTAGADVFALDGRAGAGVLHKACQGGYTDVARRLLQHGAFVDIQSTSTGHTPLFEAAWFMSVETVQLLLDHGARVDTMLRTNYGFTLDDHLTYEKRVATGKGSKEKLALIEELVNRRRAVDQERARNPLLGAVRAGNVHAVRDELAKGADTEVRYPIIGEFDDGHTALLIASRNGQVEMVRDLVAAGAEVNAVEPVFGAVPLHKATYNGHLEITKILAGVPNINLDYQGPSNGYSPLLDAIWHGFSECAMVLLNAGASTDVVGYDGKRALDLAREELKPGDPFTARLEALETTK